MKSARWVVTVITTVILALWAGGCNEDVSGPGSDGLGNTGSRLVISSLDAVDEGSGGAVPTIDMVKDDCDGDGVPDEDWYDAFFEATLTVMGPTDDSDAQTGILIQGYSIDFFSTSAGAGSIPSYTFVAANYYIPANQSLTIENLVLLTANDKAQFNGDISLSPVYECRITFYGVNDFGYEVTNVGSLFVILTDYDNC
jgi:hypothetical protein